MKQITDVRVPTHNLSESNMITCPIFPANNLRKGNYDHWLTADLVSNGWSILDPRSFVGVLFDLITVTLKGYNVSRKWVMARKKLNI